MQVCKPTDDTKAITYKEVSGVEVKHGDVYVFVGCSVEHAVCNPQISGTAYYKKVWRRERKAWQEKGNTGDYAAACGAYRYSFAFQFALPPGAVQKLAEHAGVNPDEAKRRIDENIGQQLDEEWGNRTIAKKIPGYGQGKWEGHIGTWDVEKKQFKVAWRQNGKKEWEGHIGLKALERCAVGREADA